MKNYTAKELNKILRLHTEWLSGVDSRKRVDLSRTNLSRSDLNGANLNRINLYGANLNRADLSGANLYGADLDNADLRKADLSGANLHHADLSVADLSGANLYGANLVRADLRGCNLQGANLQRANLHRANLCGANLSRAIDLPVFKVPEEGDFIGWKKVTNRTGNDKFILKLLVTGDRTGTLIGNKCRTSKATPLQTYQLDGKPASGNTFVSKHDENFEYVLNTPVEVFDYDPDIRVECTRGIHFFLTRKEAEEY